MNTRPGLWQWLRYAYGLRLPVELHDWVRHDLTDADWRLREITRVAVQCAIPVGIIMFLPGPWTIRLFTAVLLVAGALFVVATYGEEMRDRRLHQHGIDVPSSRERPPNG
ncbi:MAG TPA: DUF5313 family protein [Mycobacteriales bacterium]